MDKTQYDRPDDTKGNRAFIFLGMAAAVICVFYFGYYR
jgi:predicted secreted protein